MGVGRQGQSARLHARLSLRTFNWTTVFVPVYQLRVRISLSVYPRHGRGRCAPFSSLPSDHLLVDLLRHKPNLSSDGNMDNFSALFSLYAFYVLIFVEMRCTLSPVLM